MLMNDECVIVDRELPGECRLVNWATGKARRVLVIPKEMWNDYFDQRTRHQYPYQPDQGDVPYSEKEQLPPER